MHSDSCPTFHPKLADMEPEGRTSLAAMELVDEDGDVATLIGEGA